MKFIIPILFTMMIACKKDSSNVNTSIATIYYSDPSVDGCGWSVITNNQTYDPDNLTPAFKQNNLKVVVSYSTDKDSTHCSVANVAIPRMHILDIHKQ